MALHVLNDTVVDKSKSTLLTYFSKGTWYIVGKGHVFVAGPRFDIATEQLLTMRNYSAEQLNRLSCKSC
jgi:hypothetical protein